MIDLNDEFKKLKSILCLNGEIPDKDRFARYSDLPLIAADGAANTLLGMGIIPNLVVGDLDSIDQDILSSQCEVLHIIEQETTDLEKCLSVITSRELFPCLIYGATGKESDHTIYNLNVLAEHSLNHKILFHDSAYKNKDKYGIFVSTALVASLKIGSKISVLSFNQSIASTKGLMWELNKMVLSPKASSARNLIKSIPFEIIVHSGNVLVLFDYE